MIKRILILVLALAGFWPPGAALGQTTTPNLGLTKPAIGAGNWGTTLNSNFDLLDGAFGGTPTLTAITLRSAANTNITLTPGGTGSLVLNGLSGAYAFTGNNSSSGTWTFANGTPNPAMKPPTSDAVQFVSSNGNDSNDGLSRGTAKLTVQGALNALPANGGTVRISCGSSLSFSSTIVAPSFTGPIYQIAGDCAPIKDDNGGQNDHEPTLTYTGTGTALNTQSFSLLKNFDLVGPSRSGSTVGIDCTMSGTSFENVRVGGFGTGWQEDTGCFITHWTDGSIHDNGTNIGSVASPTQAGENINFDHALISDTAANMNQTCVNLTASGGSDFVFDADSIDGCGVTINSPGKYRFTGSHFESENTGAHVYQIQILHNQVELGLAGNTFRQDNGSSNSSYFIQQGSNLGNSINAFGNTFTAGSSVSMAAVFNCTNNNPLAVLNVAGAQVSGTFTGTTFPSGRGLITTSDLSQCGPYSDLDTGTFTNQNLTVGTGASPNNWSVTSGGVVQVLGHLLSSPTAPTISSGFGTSPSIVQQNGTAAFEVNVGTGGTATSGVIGMPAATDGWSCQVTDMNTNIVTRETAFTTTTVTLTAASAWTASDKLLVNCGGF